MSNFRAIRNIHKISAATLAEILNLKSSSSVTNLERGKASPSCELLQSYANLFAVSTDWLLGRVSTYYSMENMLYSEQQTMATLQSYPIGKKFLSSLPDFYLNPRARESSYGLPIRANINFILGYSVKHYLPYLELCDRINDAPADLLDKAFTCLIDKRYLAHSEFTLSKKDEQLLQAFWLLISLRTKEPLFDIEKYFLNGPAE